MSDCGFCLYGGDGDCEFNFFGNEKRVAAKDHKCEECCRLITKGSEHFYARGISEGDFWSQRTCSVCEDVATTFYCEGRFYGSLWDDMDEQMDSLTTACLGRLRTPEAREFLRQRWMQWKGLAA